MRKLLLFVLVFGLGLAAWAQVSDTMAVTVTIGPAFPDAIDVPATLSISVTRGSTKTSNLLTLYYSTDYIGRDITVEAADVPDTMPENFALYIGKDTDGDDEPDTWVAVDLFGWEYEARTLFLDVDPGENMLLKFWIKADATELAVGDVGKQFTIILKFTLTSLP